MLDVDFYCSGCLFDSKISEKAAIRLMKNRMAAVILVENFDGKKYDCNCKLITHGIAACERMLQAKESN